MSRLKSENEKKKKTVPGSGVCGTSFLINKRVVDLNLEGRFAVFLVFTFQKTSFFGVRPFPRLSKSGNGPLISLYLKKKDAKSNMKWWTLLSLGFSEQHMTWNDGYGTRFLLIGLHFVVTAMNGPAYRSNRNSWGSSEPWYGLPSLSVPPFLPSAPKLLICALTLISRRDSSSH